MLLEALPARLKVLEDEILRLTKLAAEANETVEQDNYWRLAQAGCPTLNALQGMSFRTGLKPGEEPAFPVTLVTAASPPTSRQILPRGIVRVSRSHRRRSESSDSRPTDARDTFA
jgi:RNA:NAD 2'-phosphotransferase (TPT1/KptA family)